MFESGQLGEQFLFFFGEIGREFYFQGHIEVAELAFLFVDGESFPFEADDVAIWCLGFDL